MKKNIILGVIGIVIIIGLILALLLYSLTFGCMNKSHAYIRLFDINVLEENGQVFVEYTYEKGYTAEGLSCAYGGSHVDYAIVDGLRKSNYMDDDSVDCEVLGDYASLCKKKVYLGQNTSLSVKGSHRLKACSDFFFTNVFLKPSDPNNCVYCGMAWNSYEEVPCTEEVSFNYNP